MIKPLQNNVLLEAIKTEETHNGIILTQKTFTGEYSVIAVSDEIEELKVGMIVYATTYEGEKIDIDGKEYVIVDKSEIFGIKE